MHITNRLIISLIATSALTACGGGKNNPPAPPKTPACVDLDLTQILSSYEVTKCDGTKATGQVEACKEDGAQGCLATETYKAALTTDLATKVVRGNTVAGVSGSVTPAPADCSTAGGQNCVATGTYFAGTACGADASKCFLPPYAEATQPLKAINYNAIDVSKMLDTFTLSGATGTVVSKGSWALTDVFPGTGYYTGVSNAPAAEKIATSTTILGVPGIAVLTPPDCNTAGQQNCVAKTTYFAGTACGTNGSACYLPTYAATTQPFKAIDYDNISANAAKMQTTLSVAGVTGTIDLSDLTEGNIKNGVTIAGVPGLYPNTTYTLPSASGTADLENANFYVQVKSVDIFEYWNSAGARQTGAGDADITAANIADGVSIFGTAGTITSPVAWDLRVGSVIVTPSGTVTGKLKVNCRNRVNPEIYNYDEAVASIPNTGTIAGIAIDYWDTIEDYNKGFSGLPPGVVSGWTNNDCGGVETVADDANVWKDVTTTGDGTTPSTCTATSGNCTMKDKITGLHWSKIQSTFQTWSQAINICDALSFNGQTDWRLPTQKELMEAYTHGIRSAASTYWMTESNMYNSYFWSGSSVSNYPDNAWFVNFAEGYTYFNYKANPSYQVVCVR